MTREHAGPDDQSLDGEAVAQFQDHDDTDRDDEQRDDFAEEPGNFNAMLLAEI